MTQFLHQKIAQHHVQSVCRDCMCVIGTASHRMQLEGAERAHRCPEEAAEGFFVDWQVPRRLVLVRYDFEVPAAAA